MSRQEDFETMSTNIELPTILQQIRISVRNLVEFLLRCGDIDNRVGQGMQLRAMQEGTRIHKKLQKSMGSGYEAEVPLKLEIPTGRFLIVVEGRADGIFMKDGKPCIDEIKGIYQDVFLLEEPYPVHLAQAKCYAYIYGLRMNVPEVGVQMTYCDLDTELVKRFYDCYTMDELSEWFLGLMSEYQKWADFEYDWGILSRESVKQLDFPYPYREGQRELVSDVYRTILRKKNLFIQAPTGTGKTLSVLYPTIKAVGEGLGEHIFYLTAKTLTATVAVDTLQLLATKGYRGKVVQITAKEKLCKCEVPECNPDACPYAKGHFDRVNDAVYDLLMHHDMFTREVFLEQADRFMVCPFELCLDTSSWSDVIIGDYNYVFDPTVYLKRFFAEGNKSAYFFLVDEAHNLVERGRQMYSETIVKEDVLFAKRVLKQYSHRVELALERVNKQLLHLKRKSEHVMVHTSINDLVFAIMQFLSEMERFLQKPIPFPERDQIMELYFTMRNFINIYEFVDENYIIYSQMNEKGEFSVRLFCADPSRNLQARIDQSRTTVFFSATLLPINYYKKLLSTDPENYAVYAHSVFQKEQRLLVVATDVSSKYTRRTPREYERIATYIERIAAGKTGNYIAFFPSYQMLDEVEAQFEYLTGERFDILIQTSGMKEAQREEFLAHFEEKRTRSLVAFCVLGGIFSEGLDLREDQLIGTMIVGTGLPQINEEGELLRNFFDDRSGNGFDYVYRFPGMNKVQQAAGRVIRTLADVGVIALLDERFLQWENRQIFPREWEDFEKVTIDSVEEHVRDFWNSKKHN